MEWTKGITGFDTILDTPNVLLVWVGGKGASQMEKLTDEKVAFHCTLVLRKFMADNEICYPENIVRSAWCSNKYTCGSYSHVTVKGDQVGTSPAESLRQPVGTQSGNVLHPSLLFAGEAVHPHHYSTVHGAYESGEYQALRLLEFFKSQHPK